MQNLNTRQLPDTKKFDALVNWLAGLIEEKKMPGAIVGISGTDSILVFMALARAFESVGRDDRVWGIHCGAPFPPEGKTAEEIERILSFNPSYRWVARVIVPWLAQQAPQAKVTVLSDFDYNNDHQRWAELFHASLNGASKTEPLPPEGTYWVCGTRNATEQALGTYSNLSGAVSVQPILNLWKSDVLRLCRDLGVPQLAIDKSRQVDCDCGRYDLAANHIEEVDLILKARAGLIDRQALDAAMPADLLVKLAAFVESQIEYAGFKKLIPYGPPA